MNAPEWIAVAALLIGFVLCVCWPDAGRSSGNIRQAASKADLEAAAKIAFRRHAELHREVL